MLDGADTVLGLRPDASHHPGCWDIGVLGLHRRSSDVAVEVRAFFTEGEEPLREDPVTGSLNAAAAEWLIASGRLTAPFVAAQGTAMGRQGRVHITSENEQVWVGGHADVILTGSVLI
ncbi:PhzF family phenazine biosynthesis protein [Microbacterium sp. B35-04]|uniref:PhzF family phenazine biosynthesis protein n=1 Tax=Microbacterium sp. B35-04 TaxID=1961716 RepID=UPI0031F2DA53